MNFFKILFPVFLISIYLLGCSPNNVTVDDSLQKYFEQNNTRGCFALLDNGTGEFAVYNLKRYRDSAFLPASTFKIVNSLIGLQTGKISSDSMVIKWDGVERPVSAWNKDINMYDAFRASAVPYYQEIARKIGRDTMQQWLDSLSYGTKKITTQVDSFWLDNSLKITPDEQLGLVKKLYFNQLPFHKYNQEIVKRAMLFENNNLYKLGYKTGLGRNENGTMVAWIVGWIEENNHPYFFVLNLESNDPNADVFSVRMKIFKDILGHLGFMQGKK